MPEKYNKEIESIAEGTGAIMLSEEMVGEVYDQAAQTGLTFPVPEIPEIQEIGLEMVDVVRQEIAPVAATVLLIKAGLETMFGGGLFKKKK